MVAGEVADVDVDELTLGDWAVEDWVGAPRPDFSVADLAGRVVVAAAFQMLCPGCVETTIPQLRRAAATFPADQVAVVGLHTVFEHHDAMTPVALRAFLHEYRVAFPVAIDQAAARGPVPTTMQRFALRGTPTVMLHDRRGVLRRRTFGHVADLELGAQVAALVLEDGPSVAPTAGATAVTVTGDASAGAHPEHDCDGTGCRL